VRVCVPGGIVAGIDHPTYGRIHARNGIMDVPADVARDLIAHDDCFPAANKPRGADGFVCTSCNFHGYFRACGRCGGSCVRPHELTAGAAPAERSPS